MKILFAARSVYHFSYYESLVRAMCDKEHEVKILFDKKWSESQPDAALKEFGAVGYKGFAWAWGVRRGGVGRQLLFGLRELRSYASYLLRPDQSEFYLDRWRNYLPQPLRKMVATRFANFILSLKVTHFLLSIFETAYPASKDVVRHVVTEKPDIIVASPGNMRFDEEIEYIKAGKSLGIPTAILVLSWDNLTTKGLFHANPDLLLCWNRAHSYEAAKVHGIKSNRVIMVGSTFFDKWFGAERYLYDRKTFCMRVGLDPNRPIILYLGSSSNIAADETWLAEEVYRAMRAHSDPDVSQAQLLVRPHPANARNYMRLEGIEGLAIWPKIGTLPESRDAQSDFVNSVRHSVAAMGINTSGMIDNIILGRPCVALMTGRYVKTQDKAVHFSHLSKSGALEVAKDGIECVKIIKRLLAGDDKKKGARESFVEEFVRPYGIHNSAGDLCVSALEILAQEKRWTLRANTDYLSRAQGVV